MSEMFSQGEIDRIIEDSWHEWQEQEPCDDCISRQAAFEIIKNLYPDMPVMDIMGARRKWRQKYAPYIECENAIEQLPSVTPKPKTGHWIIISPTDMYCSECNEIEHLDTSRKFCAYCGTKMIEPQESEEKDADSD